MCFTITEKFIFFKTWQVFHITFLYQDPGSGAATDFDHFIKMVSLMNLTEYSYRKNMA